MKTVKLKSLPYNIKFWHVVNNFLGQFILISTHINIIHMSRIKNKYVVQFYNTYQMI